MARKPKASTAPKAVAPYRKTEACDFADDVIEEMLTKLADGESMRSICSDPRMPDRETIRRWAERDDGLAASIARAREVGFHERADRAVEAAKTASDAALGRLAFDAERWYLGKLSRAFADKPIAVEAKVKVDESDSFGRIAGALERAATAIAGGATRTSRVAVDGEAGPDNASG